METATSNYEKEYMCLKTDLNEASNKQAQGDPAAALIVIDIQGRITDIKTKISMALKQEEIAEAEKTKEDEKESINKEKKFKEEQGSNLKFLDDGKTVKPQTPNVVVPSTNVLNPNSAQLVGKPNKELDKEDSSPKVSSSSGAST